MDRMDKAITDFIESKDPNPLRLDDIQENVGLSYTATHRRLRNLVSSEDIGMQTVRLKEDKRNTTVYFIPDENCGKVHPSHCRYKNSVIYKKACDRCYYSGESCDGYMQLKKNLEDSTTLPYWRL